MNIMLHPISPEQRAQMPKFTRAGDLGLSDSIWDKIGRGYEEFKETEREVTESVETIRKRIDLLQNGITPENSPEIYAQLEAQEQKKQQQASLGKAALFATLAAGLGYGIYKLAVSSRQ